MLSRILSFPPDAVNQRMVEFDGTRFRAVLYTGSTIPTLIGE
jgi:hypothetical protein